LKYNDKLRYIALKLQRVQGNFAVLFPFRCRSVTALTFGVQLFRSAVHYYKSGDHFGFLVSTGIANIT